MTRRLRAPVRREQLLDTAAQLAVDGGFHVLSVESVAQRAGVTRAVIYRHFRDLEDLLATLLDRELSRADEQVRHTTPVDLGGGEPPELLLLGLGAFLQAVHNYPLTWRLVLMPPEGAPPALRARIAQGREGVLRRLTRAVQQDLAAGDAEDAELTACVLTAISDEYARLVLADPERYPPDRLLRHARLWLGLTARGASTPANDPAHQPTRPATTGGPE